MTATTNHLEIKGNLAEHPLAELFGEITQIGLEGSLRVSAEARKAMIYFREGKVVFAVSNLRQHRLAEIILAETNVERERLAAHLAIQNDLEFAEALAANQIFPKTEIEKFFVRQIEAILKTALAWNAGEWLFSPLVKIKESVQYKIDLSSLLIEYARSLPKDTVIQRFKSFKELYNLRAAMPVHINLRPKEAFVLSRFNSSLIKIEDIKNTSGLSDADTLQNLYTLWLGGFLSRHQWNTAFSDRKVTAILSAKLTLKKEAEPPKPIEPETKPEPPKAEKTPEPQPEPEKTEKEKPAEEKISLDKYLQSNEGSNNHYETLNLPINATVPQIKQAYFAFAKQFHPDLYHRSTTPEIHRRIQNAFTKLANAYETLRNEKSREVYDFRLKKELADDDNLPSAGNSSEGINLQKKAKLAAENFEDGFALLQEENYEEAIAYLGRAAHLAQDNARYHAFYGKALSFDKNQRHKAEAELQTAVRLDPDNTIYRIILAEFFIHYNLLKRAEGELNRLLAIEPDNEEALALLDSLQNK